MISPSFLPGRCGHGVLKVFLGGVVRVLFPRGIFLDVMVGGGVTGPGELMGPSPHSKTNLQNLNNSNRTDTVLIEKEQTQN